MPNPAISLYRFSYRLFGGRCVLCDGPGQPRLDLCLHCCNDMPWNLAACAFCALPLNPGTSHICRNCLAQPPVCSAVYSPLVYAFPVNRMIVAFKDQGRFPHGRVLSSLLATSLAGISAQLKASDTRVVPVPLHWSRRMKRGFNQSHIIAEQVARQLELKVAPVLRRQRPSHQQKFLTQGERHRNLSGSFGVRGEVRGRSFLLVDDVITTGATVDECSRVLLAAGALDVTAAAIARTPSAPR